MFEVISSLSRFIELIETEQKENKSFMTSTHRPFISIKVFFFHIEFIEIFILD